MGKSFAWRDGDRIVFFGDSLTRRTGVLLSGDPAARLSLYMGSWVEEVEMLVTSSQPGLRIQYWNAGMGGDTVVHLRKRVEPDVLSLDPTRVVIGIGTNDSKLINGQPRVALEAFRSHLADLLLTIRRAGDIQTTVFCTNFFADKAEWERRRAWDQACAEAARSQGAEYLPVAEIMHGRMHAALARPNLAYTTDGLHLSPVGNAALATAMLGCLGFDLTR